MRLVVVMQRRKGRRRRRRLDEGQWTRRARSNRKFRMIWDDALTRGSVGGRTKSIEGVFRTKSDMKAVASIQHSPKAGSQVKRNNTNAFSTYPSSSQSQLSHVAVYHCQLSSDGIHSKSLLLFKSSVQCAEAPV